MLQVGEARRRAGLALAFTLAGCAVSAQCRADEGMRWALDASIGVPKLSRGGFHVIGGGSAGVQAPTWSAFGRGDFAAYDLEGKGGVQQGERAEGNVEGGGSFALSPALALDARGSLGAATYDATTISPLVPLSDEGSTLYRAGGLVGLRWTSGRSFASLHLGGGAQLEQYGRTVVAQAGQSVALDDESKTTFRAEARIAARWAIVPDVVSLRIRSEGTMFSLRRDARAIRVTTSGTPSVVAAGAVDTTKQLEVRSRLFVDVDALALFGVVPAVYAGVDLLRVDGPAGVLTSTVPSAGVGLFGFLSGKA